MQEAFILGNRDRAGPSFEPLRIGALLDHTFAVVIGSPVIKSGAASGR
jgi:hypothetical protein